MSERFDKYCECGCGLLLSNPRRNGRRFIRGHNGVSEEEFAKLMVKYKIKSIEEALVCSELWELDNGETMCSKCHNKTKKGPKTCP